MQKDKQQQQNEENTYLRIVQERVNLREYAGDMEDIQLACDQAIEYIEDCERKLSDQVGRVENRNAR